ncbi:MAG TPA: hypothetical protein VFW33_21080 [Gemmataceae bacterium]|nr:hypothetical protein [Gemmataceae bacterium]
MLSSAASSEEFSTKSDTVAWLLRQPGSFFRPYAGKWIAARECQIIAVADNDRELMAQLKGENLRRILIHRVERPGRVIYRNGLRRAAGLVPAG